jgi:polysaccharide deacetylase family protein (PEP-CTERM system associated)
MKWAVLSMDIEDWYHLDYFIDHECDRAFSFLDGIEVFQNILARWQIPATFFVLGEMARSLSPKLHELRAQGHEIGVHGWDHQRPLKLSPDVFAQNVRRAKETLEELLSAPVEGYRASCFSLDRERLDLLRAAGYGYDSSYILFRDHPLYGHLDLTGFESLSPRIYHQGDFFEFQVSTVRLAGKNIPISGGGYIRFFPWFLMRRLVSKYLKHSELFVFYIHPFEMSPRKKPLLPAEASWADHLRFQIGRFRVPQRLEALIALLRENGFRFVNFTALRRELLQQLSDAGALASSPD